MDSSEAIDERDGAEQSNAMLRVPILERRVAALEKVVAIERRLRELHKARAGIGELPSAPGTLPSAQMDDATVLSRPVAAIAGDDSTELSRPPSEDATVLYRSAALVPGTAVAAPPRRAGETDLASALVLAPGFQLFEYRIDAVLGQGGFGVTYLATDVHLNAKVAIKEYLPAGFAQRSIKHWSTSGSIHYLESGAGDGFRLRL